MLAIVFGPQVALKAQSNYATPYTFTTLSGVKPGSVDGLGDAARFNSPKGVAVDAAGNVYVADYINDTIRKITPSGAVTTLAGLAGSKGSADGLGEAARFNGPSGVAVDATGNVYVADTLNCMIRKISPAGMVTTLAGSPGVFSSADGTGSDARFSSPQGVAVDAAFNVYVADTSNGTIRKITPMGIVSTLAGFAGNIGSVDGSGAAARFGFPRGVAVDVAGVLYVADTGNSTIRKITPSGVVTTLSGLAGSVDWVDGNVSAARFAFPSGIAVDVAGDIYVVDTSNETVRKIAVGGMVTTISGNPRIRGSADGPAGAASFHDPAGVAVDASGNIYIADTANHTIRKITPANVVSTVAGTASQGWVDGQISSAKFAPFSMAMDKAGNIYVGEVRDDSCTIRKITPAGVVTTLAGGAVGSADGTGGAARFNGPEGIAVDGSGNVYVGDLGNHTIRKITPSGVVTTLAGNPLSQGWVDGTGNSARFNYPAGLAIDTADNIYVADMGNNAIRKITPSGVVTTLAGNPAFAGAINGTVDVATFTSPYGVAVDLAGNIYAVEPVYNEVRKITPGGIVTTLAGSPFGFGSSDGVGAAAQFINPLGIAVDDGGMVYVTDSANNTIRKITSSGLVTTLAGSAEGSGSEDGTGNGVRFSNPIGIVVDSNGNIYIADTGNNVIRKGVLSSLPVIITQPSSLTISENYSVTLSITVSGASPTYQWQKDGVDIAGATGSSYTVSGASVSDAGSYRVIVSNTSGSVTSNAAVLMVVGFTNGVSAITSDFDSDRQSDLIWQNTVTGERSFWLMNGTTFKVGVSLGTFAPDWTIVGSGDFNGDGQEDLLWQNTITGERTIWLMNGTSFSLGVDIGTYSTDIRIMGSGDFNGDGQTDILVANTLTGETTVWVMNGTTKTSEVSLGTVPTAWSIAGTGDFNGDGKVDLIWQNAATGERTVWLMDGTTLSSTISLGIVAKQFQIVGTGDYNGDGKTDLVWTDTATGDRTIWLMNGLVHTGTATLSHVSPEWSLDRPIFLTTQTAHADFDLDGHTDMVVQNSATGERTISFMNGTSITSTISLGTLSTDWVLVGTGDFNQDDSPDLVWTNTVTGERKVWLMDGITLLDEVTLTTISPVWEISAVGDFNYDGKPDLVWTNTITGERSIWLMNGTVFGTGVSLGVVPPGWKIATAADLNGDGKTDLIWQNTATGESSVWLMNGGSFTAGVVLDPLPAQWSIVGTGDFNGDGKADLLLQNTATGERVVRLMNRATLQSSISLGIYGTELSVRN